MILLSRKIINKTNFPNTRIFHFSRGNFFWSVGFVTVISEGLTELTAVK